ncbi:MAG: DUF554 domain-containing protein [Treponema sp.]|jgi:hypothetical protein|nr:DUF554 domain-containing protein [Treponema sp.]
MTFAGSIQSGYQGDREMLLAKSILDGSMPAVFGASMGINALFSAFPTLFTKEASRLRQWRLAGRLLRKSSRKCPPRGSLVITAIGFNFQSVKEIKSANLIPGSSYHGYGWTQWECGGKIPLLDNNVCTERFNSGFIYWTCSEILLNPHAIAAYNILDKQRRDNHTNTIK